MSSTIEIEIEAAPVLSLAMVENAVPLVARLAITNTAEERIEDLVVELALLPDFSQKWTSHVSAIPPGGTFHVGDLDLPLDRSKLVNQLERGGADLKVWVRRQQDVEPIATASRTVDVLAYNEWTRTGVPLLLAAFVLPNHPVVGHLLTEARGPLEQLTRNPGLDGYQSGDPGRVSAIARAVYEAIQARGITYSNPPASFERTGQKIRTPEQLVAERLGTCLDLSTLIAACLEQAGLYPLIVLIQGHAFPAVWLEDHYVPEALIDDPALLRKLVELGRILVFDSSAVANRPVVSFDEATKIAKRQLESTPFDYAIDLHGARKQHFLPLPLRVAGEYAAVPAVRAVHMASAPTAVPRLIAGDGSSKGRSSPRSRNPRVEAWKQRLLDTSLRNRLLNYRDTKQSLHLLCDQVSAVEDHLASGEDLVVRPRPSVLGGDDPRSKRILDSRVADDAVKAFLRDRLGHGEIHSDLDTDQTFSRLTTIYRGAREALEETGANTLCLTIGMLEWFESDSSEKPRRAPILLVPVTLVRDNRTTGFTVRASGEDTRLNVTMFEKLRIDTGITLPELSELPLDQVGVDVPQVLNRVRQAVVNLRRWEVKEELHLGLFSFAKFQMWADLDQNIDAILANPVVNHLVAGKNDTYPNDGAFLEPHEIDERTSTSDLICPLDADASQLAAVAAAAQGKTFVLQGPPGTGKSQTITNLIAHCIAQGKRVLFVAEKAAALEVVQRRLTHIGLSPYVLELHSHKSGKQQVLEQFKNALEARAIAEPETWEQRTRKLADDRRQLNSYVAALHRRHPGGFSVFHALSKLSALREAPVVDLPARCADAPARLEELRGHVDDLREAMVELGPVSETSWQGCSLPSWQADLPARLRDALDQAPAAIDAAEQAARHLAASLGANPPSRLEDVDSLGTVAMLLEGAPPRGDAIHATAEWPSLQRDGTEVVDIIRARSTALVRLRDRYSEQLFELELSPLEQRFRRYAGSFWLVAWWGLRSARKVLRSVSHHAKLRNPAEIADDLQSAGSLRTREARVAELAPAARSIFGPLWAGTDSDPSKLEDVLAWGSKFHAAITSTRAGVLPARIQGAVEPSITADAIGRLARLRAVVAQIASWLGWDARAELARAQDQWQHLRQRVTRWRGDLSRIRSWHAYLVASQALTKAGCNALVDAVGRGDVGAERVTTCFERSIYQSWTRQAFENDPLLNKFDGDQHRRRVAGFAELDRVHLRDCRDVACARVGQRVPPPTATTSTGSEMGILKRELEKKRRQMPIRRLLQEVPSIAARLKPCFLMSPMSVAQYLDPKTTQFDLVVFDEASQIPTHDAVGVLARGKSAIVVGDSKQLPPTSFFQGGAGDDEGDDESDFEELESILDECKAAGLPERKLDWHYRSRHESLIAFSNFHYYRNRLNTFPSAEELCAGRGVSFRRVEGYYDKGGSRTNQEEARAVVAELVGRLRRPDASSQTYGIVTFSQAQQSLVEDLLDRARKDYPEIQTFFDEKVMPEPVIVKNLENIQGDERDVMLFSICYGPDPRGVVSMNFGPLNRDGGERRLNVAVTRAREELIVFSTLTPEQIDLTRTNAVGVKHLKTFLDYAQRGPAAIAEALTVQSEDQFDSPFEEQVCERLRDLNWQVDTQVGCAGYKIDMAVRDPAMPGRYLLGVECDGAAYHSARSARERDRLRGQVLAGLGWNIHRIWSTDWWIDPQREIEKVIAALERCKAQPRSSPSKPLTAHIAGPIPPTTTVPARPSAPLPVPRLSPAAEHEAALYARATAAPTRTATSSVVPYEMASIPAGRRMPDDVHDERLRDELRDLLLGVVKVEAPLSLRLLARRISPYFAIGRTSTRLEDRLRSVLGRAVTMRSVTIWRLDQDPDAYRAARRAPSDARAAAEVPLEEVANAAAIVLAGNISIELDELVKLTARELGFLRTGERVAEHMSAGVAMLVRRGAARREGEKVVLN